MKDRFVHGRLLRGSWHHRCRDPEDAHRLHHARETVGNGYLKFALLPIGSHTHSVLFSAFWLLSTIPITKESPVYERPSVVNMHSA
jgi:hypothetical protein